MKKRFVIVVFLLVTSSALATTYYLSPSGSDSNNGTSTGTAWLTPNHAVNCGDILQAATGNYSYFNFGSGSWGTVTCASGNNVAWVECATFDGCKIANTSTSGWAGMWISASYWGVQGFEVTTSGSTYQACFKASPPSGAAANISHVIFANDVANGCEGDGISTSNQGSYSTDYVAIIGNVIYDAATGSELCYSGISIYQPLATDSLPGTHIYVAGNISYANVDPSTCSGGVSTDGEGIILDSINDGQSSLTPVYNQQIVVANNIFVWNGSQGASVAGSGNTLAPIYFMQNTSYGNNRGQTSNTWCADFSIDSSSFVQETRNLNRTGSATGCASGTSTQYVYQVSRSTATNVLYGNFGYSAAGNNTAINDSSGFVAFGPNNTFGTDPLFAATTEPGAPSCGSASSVPNCMATVIASFTPTNAAAAGFGYQVPSSTPVYDPLYPQWLCNVTNLPAGLVTPGCLIASAETGVAFSGGTQH